VTYGNASVNWFAQQIKVSYWEYVEKQIDVNAKDQKSKSDLNDWEFLLAVKPSWLQKKKEPKFETQCV